MQLDLWYIGQRVVDDKLLLGCPFSLLSGQIYVINCTQELYWNLSIGIGNKGMRYCRSQLTEWFVKPRLWFQDELRGGTTVEGTLYTMD